VDARPPKNGLKLMSQPDEAVVFDTFPHQFVTVSTGNILVRRAGNGPAVLLLHGFPETSVAWRKITPILTKQFTVIAADLPGYGDSSVADAALDNGRLSKREMAAALADAMTALDISIFAVVGHDRGARAAYRLALDHRERIAAIAVLDVIPILDMADRMTYEAARQMGHWFWLAQPSTVPEALIGHDPDLYVRHIIEQWDGSEVIEREALDEYVRCMRKPEVRRIMGAEYRADQLDLAHDRADRVAGRRIVCPLLAVWAKGGLTERFGDPMAIWRQWADDVEGRALTAGHFLMDESPQELAALLVPFLVEAFDHK
jgi:haloacetate dehalogenase